MRTHSLAVRSSMPASVVLLRMLHTSVAPQSTVGQDPVREAHSCIAHLQMHHEGSHRPFWHHERCPVCSKKSVPLMVAQMLCVLSKLHPVGARASPEHAFMIHGCKGFFLQVAYIVRLFVHIQDDRPNTFHVVASSCLVYSVKSISQ